MLNPKKKTSSRQSNTLRKKRKLRKRPLELLIKLIRRIRKLNLKRITRRSSARTRTAPNIIRTNPHP